MEFELEGFFEVPTVFGWYDYLWNWNIKIHKKTKLPLQAHIIYIVINHRFTLTHVNTH